MSCKRRELTIFERGEVIGAWKCGIRVKLEDDQENFIFQDDNAPIHTARVVKSWEEENEDPIGLGTNFGNILQDKAQISVRMNVYDAEPTLHWMS
ncbi:hypothetical protein RIR_jg37764.t1 [Rhizophagus irregularis DAOM 181602=DAOM 197198]|nr:hypothetical protein RIR_jg37764.t1 [Rhizophagus irregularis DAOM 181602=DAOM 197198]